MSRTDKWNQRYAGKGDKLPELPAVISDQLATLPKGRTLDLACGDGAAALQLAGLGHDVVAVDFAEQGILRMRQFAESQGLNIDGRVADLQNLQSLDGLGQFDNIVICRYKPEPDLIQALSELMCIDGYLFISTFNTLHHQRSGFRSELCLASGQYLETFSDFQLEFYLDGVPNNSNLDIYLFKRLF